LYIRPKTVDDALASLATHQAQILSGGTDFFPALGDRAIRGTVIDISAIGALRGITSTPDQIRIGALTTWTEMIQAPLPRCFDALKEVAREIGAIQIQNRGTIAGNLCNASPAADGVPPLLALDAEVELASSGSLRRMPLAEFIVGSRKTSRRADELLTAVIVPRTLDSAFSSFVKLGARRYLVISISMVAAVVLGDGEGRVGAARVAVGSCSAVARRLPQLEDDLIGVPVDAALGAQVRPEHLSPLSPIDDVRATAGYRRDASLTLIKRALNRCAEKRGAEKH
jgi:CO/xanthine dehydrogenase FAD-binding subunit